MSHSIILGEESKLSVMSKWPTIPNHVLILRLLYSFLVLQCFVYTKYASLQVALDVLSDIFCFVNCTNIIKSLCWIMHTNAFFRPIYFFRGRFSWQVWPDSVSLLCNTRHCPPSLIRGFDSSNGGGYRSGNCLITYSQRSWNSIPLCGMMH